MIHAWCAIHFQVAHSYSRLFEATVLTFLAPYSSHNGRPIEDTADNCHFEGKTGLPAARRFNASQKHNGMCARVWALMTAH